jgi:hypothetical protein
MGIGPNPQSPIPNPQSPRKKIKYFLKIKINFKILTDFLFKLIANY